MFGCGVVDLQSKVVRNVQRFTRKFYGALLLSAKLFQGDQGLAEVHAEIAQTQMHQQGRDSLLKDLLEMDAGQLQQWVRESWSSDGHMDEKLKKFYTSVVKPSLSCHVGSVTDQMAFAIQRFTAIIAGNEADEEDVVKMKVAAFALSGDLSCHPLITGLALACRRLVDKQQRGIETLRGRKATESARESALVADAGYTLALMGGNAELARNFGLPASTCKISFADLHANSLPTPALAILSDDTMRENFILADQRFFRESPTPKRASDSVSFFEKLYEGVVLWLEMLGFQDFEVCILVCCGISLLDGCLSVFL